MCDYSLSHAKSRPAAVDDKLIVQNFGRGTSGFCSPSDTFTAVCLLPGTEIAFDAPPAYREAFDFVIFPADKTASTATARFRQINTDNLSTHHDALEFGTGEFVLLTNIKQGSQATVLQLPAAPRNEAEAKAQTRLETVG